LTTTSASPERSADGRVGFQRLVSEVSLDHVGLILGIEMSRLARSCKDWHPTFGDLRLFRPSSPTSTGSTIRPVQRSPSFGTEGTMSEAELHILKQRNGSGAPKQSASGALRFALPVGYVWDQDDQICFDPDEQVQEIVRLIFRNSRSWALWVASSGIWRRTTSNLGFES